MQPIQPILCDRCRREISTGLAFAGPYVTWRGQRLNLTWTEGNVLKRLHDNPHKFLSYTELAGTEANARTIIKRLRRKLTEAGAPAEVIKNMPHRGYCWKGEGQ